MLHNDNYMENIAIVLGVLSLGKTLRTRERYENLGLLILYSITNFEIQVEFMDVYKQTFSL